MIQPSFFRPRPFWRLWVATHLQRFAYIVEYLVLAFLRPEDLIENNRRFYGSTEQVNHFTNQEFMKVNPLELRVLDHYVRPEAKGKALVLGCAGGREASALLERQWEIVGIDLSEPLIDGARRLFKGNTKANWYCRDVTKGINLETRFDFICLWSNLYNLIPTRKLRIQLLKDCRAHLTPQGVCSLSFFLPTFSSVERWAHIGRRKITRFMGDHQNYEIGYLWDRGIFIHQFSSFRSVIKEIHSAGLEIVGTDTQAIQRMLILKPGTTRSYL